MADEEVILADTTADSAAGPKRVRVDGMGESEEHPLDEQVAAAKFLPPAAIRARVGGGIKFTKATAGGAA
jgi:hypothetical protein